MMELYKTLPEGTLAELIDGSIYMSPSPTTAHQRIIGKLFMELSAHFEGKDSGEVFLSPYDVFLDEVANAVQPDLVVVLSNNSEVIAPDAIHGVPDLLIEVLSPGNPSHDLVRKKELYQKFRVKEYWIIDPKTKEAFGHFLDNGQYKEAYKFTGEIKSPLLGQNFSF